MQKAAATGALGSMKCLERRNLITKFAIGGLAVGSLICLTAKKTWEGQFQIVLQKNNEIPYFIHVGGSN